MASASPLCDNTDCRVAVDGKCVEGLSLEECPYYGRISVEDIEEVEAPDVTPSERQPAIGLYTGDALDRSAASFLQRRRLSRTVGIIGPHDSGKTSLIASVFDLLQGGPIGDYAFAGSSTLVGFEKACHHARSASRRDQPHTPRTTVGVDATFFHLDLVDQRAPGVVSLFIADRSGEDYLAASDEIARADDYFELRRADTVTILVNGAQLADSSARHEVRASTPQLIGALAEAGAIRRHHRIAMVLTKNDVVLASDHAGRVVGDFDQMVASVTERYGTQVTAVERFVIAAQPDAIDNVDRGAGVDLLLAEWMRPREPNAVLAEVRKAYSRRVDSFGMDKAVGE